MLSLHSRILSIFLSKDSSYIRSNVQLEHFLTMKRSFKIHSENVDMIQNSFLSLFSLFIFSQKTHNTEQSIKIVNK